MRLDDLNIGESKIIKKILDNKLTLRFIEMGVFPGEKVKIINRNNKQNLIVIQITDYLLCIRDKEAKEIEV